MRVEESAKSKSIWKKVIVLSSIFAMICVVAVSALVTLDRLNVFKMTTDVSRFYTISFYNGEKLQEEIKFKKGEIVEENILPKSVKYAPSKSIEYEFRGWDYNEDGIADTFNFRIYSNYKAYAVFALRLVGGGILYVND